MKKQYISPTFRAFDIHAEQVLAMSITIDGGQQAEQWTQQKGWYEGVVVGVLWCLLYGWFVVVWTDAADGGEEDQGYW